MPSHFYSFLLPSHLAFSISSGKSNQKGASPPQAVSNDLAAANFSTQAGATMDALVDETVAQWCGGCLGGVTLMVFVEGALRLGDDVVVAA